MTGLEIIQLLWEAGKTVIEMASVLKKKKEEERKKLSALFNDIGQLLHETFDMLNAGQYPYHHCAQIAEYGRKIKVGFKSMLGKEEAERLGNMLITAHEVERLHAELGSGAVPHSELVKLEEASGRFIAASKLILL